MCWSTNGHGQLRAAILALNNGAEIMDTPYRTALIVGAGPGISASVARALGGGRSQGRAGGPQYRQAGASGGRNRRGTVRRRCHRPGGGRALFEAADARIGVPDVVMFNASAAGAWADRRLDPEPSASHRDLGLRRLSRRPAGGPPHDPHGKGAILLTGASASVKGYRSRRPSRWASSRLRGLAQSTARELAPQGIHVAHFVIDGGVRSARRPDPPDRPDSTLDPDAIAQSYLEILASRAAPGVGGRAATLGRDVLRRV